MEVKSTFDLYIIYKRVKRKLAPPFLPDSGINLSAMVWAIHSSLLSFFLYSDLYIQSIPIEDGPL